MIGRKGGLKSKRRLSKKDAKMMVKLREAKKAFKKFYSRCFWHMKPDLKITPNNIHLIVRGLKNYGNREAFFTAYKLCR